MITQKDKQEIKTIFKEEFDEQYEKRFKFLPTKEEFFTAMDEVMGELKGIREEQELITHRVSQHTDQLEDHETRITKLQSPTATI